MTRKFYHKVSYKNIEIHVYYLNLIEDKELEWNVDTETYMIQNKKSRTPQSEWLFYI